MQNKYLNGRNRSLNIVSVIAGVLLWLLVIVAVLRMAFALIYFKVYVVGLSMSGTLIGAPSKDAEGGDYVYAFRDNKPRRGDIVVIETDHKTIIKRVIALGGDTVKIIDGVLYLNGEVKSEPYVLAENNTPSENNFDEITVPEGKMFCMGDNRNVSIDSRSEIYGCMPVNWTVGIVANWSMSLKTSVTAFNTFIDFTVPASDKRH